MQPQVHSLFTIEIVQSVAKQSCFAFKGSNHVGTQLLLQLMGSRKPLYLVDRRLVLSSK